MSEGLPFSIPSSTSSTASNADVTNAIDPLVASAEPPQTLTINPLLTNGILDPMQTVTDEAALFDASPSSSSSSLASLNGAHTSSSSLADASMAEPAVMLEDGEHSPGPYLDEMMNGADKLDSDDDSEERSRMIRLNGDDSSPSQESSQESVTGFGVPDAESAEPDLRRVKVYELVGPRWLDRGTAFCQGDFDLEAEEARLIARSEETHETLLNCVVRVSDVYQRQQETLIVWTEPDGTDFALSFQDVEGCNEVWDFITEVQRHLSSRDDQMYSTAMPSTAQQIIQSGHIPSPGLDPHLIAEIEKALRTMARSPKSRETICNYMLDRRYVFQMLETFEIAEKEEHLEVLHALCSCMQTILLLNEHTMYEHILTEELWMGVVGMLEYDPEFPKYRANYREFLEEKSHFMQPILIEDPNIHRKIHHTYRLQYLKDVILGRALDDSTFNVLNTCIIFNQIEIINHIQHDDRFLRELVLLFVRPALVDDVPSKDTTSRPPQSSPSADSAGHSSTSSDQTAVDERRKEVITLLQQLCVMGKNVQLPARVGLFRTLVERGVLYAVQWALTRPEKPLVFTAGEILTVLLDHGTVAIRNHILVQASALGQPTGPPLPEGMPSWGINVARSLGFITADDTEESAERAALSTQPFKETLAQVMCRMLSNTQDFALQNLMADSLRLLTDVPPPEPEQAGPGPKLLNRPLRDDPSTERFLENFYKVCVETLLRPLTHDVPDHRELKDEPLHLSREQGNLYLYLCDLLCSFAIQHSFRSYFFVLASNIDSRVASLLLVRDKHLCLAALRFFRICLKMNNKNLFAHLHKHECYTPIVDLTVREARKDNLISCSAQEFFEFMRKENLREPIHDLMGKHEAAIRELGYVALGAGTFRGLVQRWEINKEPPPTAPEKRSASSSSPFSSVLPRLFTSGQSLRESDAEDRYFSAEDDEDPVVPVPQASNGLLGLFRRKRQRISAPGPLTAMNKGPQNQKEGQPQRKDKDRQGGFSMQHLRPVSPLSSLLEYDDEEDAPLALLDDLPEGSSSQPRQIEIPPYDGSSSDPEDDLLESLVSKAGDKDSSSDREDEIGDNLLNFQGKRRRASEEEEEDALERLAPKNRRLSFSVNDVSELPSLSSTEEGGSADTSSLSDLNFGDLIKKSLNTKESDELADSDPKAKSTTSTTGPKKLKLKLSGSKSLLGGGPGAGKTIPIGESKDGGNG